jgi:hypothetical protein
MHPCQQAWGCTRWWQHKAAADTFQFVHQQVAVDGARLQGGVGDGNRVGKGLTGGLYTGRRPLAVGVGV